MKKKKEIFTWLREKLYFNEHILYTCKIVATVTWNLSRLRRNSIYFALIGLFCKICFVIIRLAIFLDKVGYKTDMKSEIMILANID